jgi:hypothetical protein
MLNEVCAKAETGTAEIYVLLAQKNSYPGLLKTTTLYLLPYGLEALKMLLFLSFFKHVRIYRV